MATESSACPTRCPLASRAGGGAEACRAKPFCVLGMTFPPAVPVHRTVQAPDAPTASRGDAQGRTGRVVVQAATASPVGVRGRPRARRRLRHGEGDRRCRERAGDGSRERRSVQGGGERRHRHGGAVRGDRRRHDRRPRPEDAAAIDRAEGWREPDRRDHPREGHGPGRAVESRAGVGHRLDRRARADHQRSADHDRRTGDDPLRQSRSRHRPARRLRPRIRRCRCAERSRSTRAARRSAARRRRSTQRRRELRLPLRSAKAQSSSTRR